MSNPTTVINAPGAPGYQILIGRGLLDELNTALGAAVRKVLLVYPEGMQASAELIAETITSSGKQIWQLPVADGDAWVVIFGGRDGV